MAVLPARSIGGARLSGHRDIRLGAAGDRARYFPEDDRFLLTRPERVHHYRYRGSGLPPAGDANVGGARDHWLLSLRRFPRKLFGRDKPLYSEVIVLVQGIRPLLCTTASVTDVTWYWVPNGAA